MSSRSDEGLDSGVPVRGILQSGRLTKKREFTRISQIGDGVMYDY